jgi:hypothetical protein
MESLNKTIISYLEHFIFVVLFYFPSQTAYNGCFAYILEENCSEDEHLISE